MNVGSLRRGDDVKRTVGSRRHESIRGGFTRGDTNRPPQTPTMRDVWSETVTASVTEAELVVDKSRLFTDPPPGLLAAFSWRSGADEATTLLVWESPQDRGIWSAERMMPLFETSPGLSPIPSASNCCTVTCGRVSGDPRTDDLVLDLELVHPSRQSG